MILFHYKQSSDVILPYCVNKFYADFLNEITDVEKDNLQDKDFLKRPEKHFPSKKNIFVKSKWSLIPLLG